MFGSAPVSDSFPQQNSHSWISQQIGWKTARYCGVKRFHFAHVTHVTYLYRICPLQWQILRARKACIPLHWHCADVWQFQPNNLFLGEVFFSDEIKLSLCNGHIFLVELSHPGSAFRGSIFVSWTWSGTTFLSSVVYLFSAEIYLANALSVCVRQPVQGSHLYWKGQKQVDGCCVFFSAKNKVWSARLFCVLEMPWAGRTIRFCWKGGDACLAVWDSSRIIYILIRLPTNSFALKLGILVFLIGFDSQTYTYNEIHLVNELWHPTLSTQQQRSVAANDGGGGRGKGNCPCVKTPEQNLFQQIMLGNKLGAFLRRTWSWCFWRGGSSDFSLGCAILTQDTRQRGPRHSIQRT